MATVPVKVFIETELPAPGSIVPHALYLIKRPNKSPRIYKGNPDGQGAIAFSNADDLVYIGENAPPATTEARFWLQLTEDAVKFYINITPNDASATWMDPIIYPAMPAFAGNGEAETMSRSDHYHEGIYIAEPAW